MADSKQPEAGDGEFVACLSAKEIKKLAKPEFAAQPDTVSNPSPPAQSSSISARTAPGVRTPFVGKARGPCGTPAREEDPSSAVR
jgi:hypothetical protein